MTPASWKVRRWQAGASISEIGNTDMAKGLQKGLRRDSWWLFTFFTSDRRCDMLLRVWTDNVPIGVEDAQASCSVPGEPQ